MTPSEKREALKAASRQLRGLIELENMRTEESGGSRFISYNIADKLSKVADDIVDTHASFPLKIGKYTYQITGTDVFKKVHSNVVLLTQSQEKEHGNLRVKPRLSREAIQTIEVFEQYMLHREPGEFSLILE